ncbi:MAG: exodeoxyribonuclease V subunit gamma [Burkholderiales bacterium]
MLPRPHHSMLTIHYSNRLETLAEELAALTSEPLASPFSREIVVVQSRGVARWLSLRLADHRGVCANVEFPFPNAYAWELYRAVLGQVPETSQFDPAVLTWRILAVLPELEVLPAFIPVHNYVGGDLLRRFDLATQLAASFDEYLVYRPDWIADWERGKDKRWQAELWRRLVRAAGGSHRAALQKQLLEMLGAPLWAAGAVPERVSIFGAPALPPALLELFAALGQHTDVHLFVQNPCREYWGDIAAESQIARKKLARKADAAYLETGNSLLASLGKQGRDFIDLMTEIESQTKELFIDPAGTSLLAMIQSDILNLRERRTPDTSVDTNDRSIQIHACHSVMREVEVLHDQLLALFSEHPGIEPSDVVVMTPDIETYGAYIEAVFGTAEPRIPFNISDRSAEAESTLAATFMALLELPESRYDANRVLAVLDEPAVQRRFRLAEGDLDTVHAWVREAQIRWGIDGKHRASFDLPATHEHTWRFGLDRLLLGYALPGGNERLFAGVLPFDEVEGSLGALLGRFQSFAEDSIALRTTLSGAKPIAHWVELLRALLARFFLPDEERQVELDAIEAVITALESETRAAQYTQPVPLEVVKSALRARLETPGRAFLSGGVTFCAMVPMRSLPFEIVCMIGMNDRAFPRMRRPLGFDLMADDFRKGDRSRRDDDRYLFLESVLSARRSLYVSYTGRDIREDTVIPPSVLVSELLDTIARGFRSDDGEDIRDRLVTVHPLQAFSRRYFEADSRLFSHSSALCRAASIAGKGTRAPQPFITEDLPEPEAESRTVDLESLIRFFSHPTRYLFQTRLDIRLETAEEEIESREPFAPDGLGVFKLRERLLDLALREQPHDGLALARAGGVLPHGSMGTVLFENETEFIDRFAEKLKPMLPRERLDPVTFELRSDHVTLTGTLTGLSREGLLDYRVANANARARVQAWIRHLAMNAFAPRGVERTSRCVAQDCMLTFAPVDNAGALLTELLELYWKGLHRPLHFFLRTACAYAESGDINYKVRNVWLGGRDVRGECEDPYYNVAFRGTDPLDDEFRIAAHTVFVQMNAALKEAAFA